MTETLGPVDHIARPPLPWRTTPTLTECGKGLVTIDAARIITPAELTSRIGRLGQKRAAYTTCMTCWDSAERHRSGSPDPIELVIREAQAVQHSRSYPPQLLERMKPGERNRAIRDASRRERLSGELEAIAALVAAHRDEFDGYLVGRSEAVSLADRRAARRRSS